MNMLFTTLSLKKKKKLEEYKSGEYYAFKTSKDCENYDIFNAVVGHAISAVVSEMTLNPENKEAKSNFATVSFGNKVLFIGMTESLSSV